MYTASLYPDERMDHKSSRSEVSNSSIIPTKDEMIEHIETEKALDKVGIKILEASVCQSEWRKAQCFLTVGPKACERTREARRRST